MKKPNITFKSLLQSIKNIQKRNEYFDYLSDEGKRLEIAWDMLRLLMNSKLKANGVGKYYWNEYLLTKTRILDSKGLQKYLNENIPECTVCARGGLMISQIRLGNSIRGSDSNRDNGDPLNLKGFAFNDFIQIENEYEHSMYQHPYDKGTTEKLMNICCNILVNGNFDKNDKTDYLI